MAKSAYLELCWLCDTKMKVQLSWTQLSSFIDTFRPLSELLKKVVGSGSNTGCGTVYAAGPGEGNDGLSLCQM